MVIEGQIVDRTKLQAVRETGARLFIAVLAFAAGVFLAPAILP
jgi:hypothetical protein